MSEVIKMEYRDPGTGALSTKNVTVDVDTLKRYSDTTVFQTVCLYAKAGTADVYEHAADLVEDLFDGKPSKPKAGVAQVTVDAAIAAASASITTYENAETLGIEANVPCAVMSTYGTIVDYIVPSAVSGTTITVPTTGWESLAVDIKKGYLIQKLTPQESSLGENSVFGIRAQLERPDPPTLTAEDNGSTAINVTLTAPTSNAYVIKGYDIYVIDDSEDFDLTNPAINPNRIPDVLDTTTTGSAITVSTYGGGADAGGGAIAAGTYYVVAVAKDNTGVYNVNESLLSDPVTVTVA